MKVLITGASGFIGQAMLKLLSKRDDCSVVAASRTPDFPTPTHVKSIGYQDSNLQTELRNSNVVIHLAGLAHTPTAHEAEYKIANVDFSIALARLAARSGVERFIFVSSIGVMGDHTEHTPFNEESLPRPIAEYAKSKLTAEIALKEILLGTRTALTIIRPPLVYAATAPGNFHKLLRAISLGIPIPLGSTRNLRSSISIDNFSNFLEICIDHPKAANELFVIAEPRPYSTTALLEMIISGMQFKPLMIRVPPRVMGLFLTSMGKQSVYRQLFGTLIIDSSKAEKMLGWRPVIETAVALANAGREFERLRKN